MTDSKADLNHDEEPTTTINFKPSFVLIAIDTHSSMFEERKSEEDDDKTHSFKDALTACYEIADSLILSTSKSNYNQFGVILANEDQKASFIEVENNLLDTVKLLKEECQNSNEELKRKYQRQGDIDLAAFFLLCKKKFNDIKAAYYKRTLIYITNDDDPLKGDAQKKFATLNEAKTFEPSDIALEVITMNEVFDYTKFYNELLHLCTKSSTASELCQNKDGLVEKLSSSIVFRYTKLRYNFYPFSSDYTRYLKLMKVNFIREAKIISSSKAHVDGKLLVKVKSEENPKSEEPITFTVPLGLDGTVNFDLKDKYDIYYNTLPLGFHLQYISHRHSDMGIVIDQVSILLLDPKEELGHYFEQFWQYCVDNDKVLVCLKKYRHPVEIRYVELIPKYANNQKLFLIKDIPFCEEIMMPKSVKTAQPKSCETSQKQKEAIRNLIEKLTCEYDPNMFVNPSYNKKKAYVKAKLLDLPEETVEDPTADTEGIDEQIKEAVEDIERVFHISGEMPQAKGVKRKANVAAGSGRGKRGAK